MILRLLWIGLRLVLRLRQIGSGLRWRWLVCVMTACGMWSWMKLVRAWIGLCLMLRDCLKRIRRFGLLLLMLGGRLRRWLSSGGRLSGFVGVLAGGVMRRVLRGWGRGGRRCCLGWCVGLGGG